MELLSILIIAQAFNSLNPQDLFAYNNRKWKVFSESKGLTEQRETPIPVIAAVPMLSVAEPPVTYSGYLQGKVPVVAGGNIDEDSNDYILPRLQLFVRCIILESRDPRSSKSGNFRQVAITLSSRGKTPSPTLSSTLLQT